MAREACGALRILLMAAENKVYVAQRGGIERVVHAMEAFTGDLDLQKNACGAIRKLAELPGTFTQMRLCASVVVLSIGCAADNRDLIRELGGTKAVVCAMEANRGSAELQRQACASIWNIACNNATNKTHIREVTALFLGRVRSDSELVLVVFCFAQLGGIEAVLGALESCADKESFSIVALQGAGALWILSSGRDVENKRRIGAAGAKDGLAMGGVERLCVLAQYFMLSEVKVCTRAWPHGHFAPRLFCALFLVCLGDSTSRGNP